MFAVELRNRAGELVSLYRSRDLTLVTAESCTGGLVAGLITEIPGSSNVLERGYVTYSNASKADCLGVPVSLLEKFGAVSAEVAMAMAEGALAHSEATIALAVTGIAGPGGGSPEKPVGLVYFAYGRAGRLIVSERRFGDRGRTEIRLVAVSTAIDFLISERAEYRS